MKSIIEIEIMLESEINNHLDKLKNHLNLDYFKISNRLDPKWIPDPTIFNPYFPK